MNKEEVESLFEKYKVIIPKEKQGQSECYKCKENHKYSLTWTSFLYEYEEHYYCYEHILNILLQKQNTELKEKVLLLQASEPMLEFAKQTYKDNWNKLKEWLEDEIKYDENWYKPECKEYIGQKRYPDDTIDGFNYVLDKMQEIEGGMNE